MKNAFEHLIIIGRPACGKSEFIDFIKNKVSDEERLERFHIAPFCELDDFVWLLEKCEEDDLWEELGCKRLVSRRSGHAYIVSNHALWDFLIERMNLEVKEKKGQTLLIEFSRGTKTGYRNAFDRLSREILERAAVFYIKVSCEESARRNEARYREKLRHSILAHKVPDEEMNGYYRLDDWEDLTGGRESGYLGVAAKGPDPIRVPFVTMDNEPESMDPKVLGERYGGALGRLWSLCQI